MVLSTRPLDFVIDIEPENAYGTASIQSVLRYASMISAADPDLAVRLRAWLSDLFATREVRE